ncbi:hypothetical protein SAMN05192534_102146 [Alteribacillus persepolensis]|uniref:Uncharacterized protein n=1 Tax=Alteribacillus persepolensis TaxID=568899 RepID=A0A1G8AHZ6_9BACI|nr:hypothetical protein [Alteribacillus persepolensis]SDH19930.1 hypothetical protein SAMN05192534_102146 [Alteribacillus persepolensis]
MKRTDIHAYPHFFHILTPEQVKVIEGMIDTSYEQGYEDGYQEGVLTASKQK